MNRLAKLSKVFSDLNRLKILALAIRDKELCVCEICDTLELSQPLVSRHLKQMREVNILTSYKKGKWVMYSVTNAPDDILLCWINEIKKSINTLPKLISCDVK